MPQYFSQTSDTRKSFIEENSTSISRGESGYVFQSDRAEFFVKKEENEITREDEANFYRKVFGNM